MHLQNSLPLFSGFDLKSVAVFLLLWILLSHTTGQTFFFFFFFWLLWSLMQNGYFQQSEQFSPPLSACQLLSLKIAIVNLLEYITANPISCNSLKHEIKELLISHLPLVLIMGCKDWKCLKEFAIRNNQYKHLMSFQDL